MPRTADVKKAAPPPPRLPPVGRIERADARVAFTFFAILGFASPFLAELVVEQKLGFETHGIAEDLSMTSLVALVLFGILALGLGLRAWPLLLAGVLVADLAAFLGWLVLVSLGT